MPYWVRKIQKQKWPAAQGEPIGADAVTSDLKTKNNALSVWVIDSPDSLAEAALAIAANQEHLERLDLAWLSQQSLLTRDISAVETEGSTPVADLKDAHRDLIELDLERLSVIAKSVAHAVGSDSTRRFTKNEVRALISDAIEEGRLDAASLKDRLREKLKPPASG